MLSAYYVFIWNPHAANNTQTPNAERLVMALQRAGGEYVFANSADHEYIGKKTREIKNSVKFTAFILMLFSFDIYCL